MKNIIIKNIIIVNIWRNLVFNAKYLSEFAAQLFFPANCMACNAAVAKMGTICNDCFVRMRIMQAPECHKCGEPFAFEVENDALCDNCATNPPIYDCAKSLWAYDDLSGKIVKGFKFSDKTSLAPHLGQLLAVRGADLIAKADIIAPVPLHFKRLRERRYNQAGLLCNHIAKNTIFNTDNKHKLIQDLLIRTRYTTPQTELPFTKRQQNVDGVFRVNPKYAKSLAGKNILLIDDVITTGATLNACAATLKAKNANEVYVLTLTKRLLDE